MNFKSNTTLNKISRSVKAQNSISSAISKAPGSDIIKTAIPDAIPITQNDLMLDEGLNWIGISPFDNFFIFTLTGERNGQDIPLDLSDNQEIYINFYDKKNEIKVSSSFDDSINPKKGEILFKIKTTDSRKILELSKNTYYITTKKSSITGESDESVLYTGKFYEYDKLPDRTLEYKLESLLNKYNTETKDLTTKLSAEIKINKELNLENKSLEKEIFNLTKSNKKFNNKLEALMKKVPSEIQQEIERILADKDIQIKNSKSNSILDKTENSKTNNEILKNGLIKFN